MLRLFEEGAAMAFVNEHYSINALLLELKHRQVCPREEDKEAWTRDTRMMEMLLKIHSHVMEAFYLMRGLKEITIDKEVRRKQGIVRERLDAALESRRLFNEELTET